MDGVVARDEGVYRAVVKVNVVIGGLYRIELEHMHGSWIGPIFAEVDAKPARGAE